MPTPKRILQSIVPPLLWDAGKDLKRRMRRSVNHFAWAPKGWATTLPAWTKDTIS